MDCLIGRQQIYDRDLNLYGYELLFRNLQGAPPETIEGTRSTKQIIVDAMLEHGLEKVVGSYYAFINFTRDNILSGTPLLLPKDRVVIEILEDVSIDEPLIEAVATLVKQGYQIALDDFVFSEEWRPLVDFAHIIKLDAQQMNWRQSLMHIRQLNSPPVKILAEKIETVEQFQEFEKLGCYYFQGFFFNKPSIVCGKRIATNDYAVLMVLTEINKPDINTQDLAKAIASDAGLSYKLLRYINSAYFSLPQKISSIQHAILYLGTQEIRRWANLIALLDFPNAPKELIRTALIRAKICELLGAAVNSNNCEQFFLAGLLSILDQLLETTFEQIASSLPLAEEVVNALVSQEGVIGEALNCAINYEYCNFSAVNYCKLPASEIGHIFLDGIAWAMQINLSGH